MSYKCAKIICAKKLPKFAILNEVHVFNLMTYLKLVIHEYIYYLIIIMNDDVLHSCEDESYRDICLVL